jgi:hypothetical protein
VGLTFLDPERFERFRVRGGGRLIIAMSLGRIAGKAVRVEGGYRISGRWPFASGSPFATWLGGMSVVSDAGGAPIADPSGQPQRLLAIWPADQARLIDTWDGLGLRGTVYRGRAIEKAFRDINTAANHTNYVDTAYAAIGSYFLTRDREGGPEIAGRPFP